MEQIPAAMDRHLEVVQCHQDSGLLLGASSLTGRYWYGSLWYYQSPGDAPNVEKCTAGVQLEAGLGDACWVGNNKVLVGMDTGSVALWELTDDHHTFIQQSSTTEHDNMVSSVSVCQGQTTAVSASHDRSIKIWDLETCSSVHTYTGHSDSVLCVRCHHQQPTLFLSASQDGGVCLWDTRNSKPASRLDKAPLQSIPTCVAWRPGVEHTYGVGSDAGQLVVRDTRAAVTEAISCTPHHRTVTRICFSSKRTNLLASVSEDCSVVVTDVGEDQPKQIYRDTNHRDFVRGVTWSDELRLYTCGWDSAVRTHAELATKPEPGADTEQSKMEVNGDTVPDTPPVVDGVANSDKCPGKVQMNGGGDNEKVEDKSVTDDVPATVAT